MPTLRCDMLACLQSPGVARGLRLFRRRHAIGAIASLLATFVLAGSASDAGRAAPCCSFANIQERTLAARDGSAYRLFVVVPNKPAPPSGWPVLYVLDGNSVAGLMADLMRAHPGRDDAAGFAPGLVVAIGYPTERSYDMRRRAMDYTAAPALAGSGTYLTPEQTGGADRFLAFLEDELKPSIARDFPVDAARQAIMGHSFGGLFVLHALFTRPQAFSAYIANSASIWWADRAILATADAFLARTEPLTGKRLLITVGGYEQAPSPAQARVADAAAIAARLRGRRQVDAARDLAERLRAAGPGLEVALREIPGETHGSVAPISAIYGLRFAFPPDHHRSSP